ncbi:MAG: hypothetical protein H6737_13995 [Alphaproteobacteria bacterium]|nr:hypothetical protein [Alphaproteobacteria bacterium]
MSAPELPAGVAEAAGLTAGLDAVLGAGFARLTPDQSARLGDLAAAFTGTPLGPTVSEAVAALGRGELLAHHLAALAAARASLEGARADAVLAVLAARQGLTLEEPEVSAAPTPGPEVAVRMESARQWLVELALAGLCQLDNATIVPVMATLEGIQAHGAMGGLAAVLTGFANELLDHAPTSAIADPPLRRWADLWSRCLLGTYALPEVPTSRAVSGTLTVLGADIRHHDHVVSLVVHGLLEEGGAKRLVRTTLTAWKVDAVAGEEIWNLVRPIAPELVEALATPKALAVSGMTLWSTGDLVWDGSVSVGAAVDPFAVDLSGALLVAPAPRDRHPLQVAVPVVYSGIAVTDRVLDGLAVDLTRVSHYSDYDPPEIDSSDAMVALLRYDEGFSLQPLAGRKGKKVFGPAEGIAAAAKVKAPALDVLRERASKLLRA